MIVTTDFEALYAYKRGNFKQCLQLSTQNVHALLYAVRMPSIRVCPEFIQLLDDDIVSLTALTLIVDPKCRDWSYKACITQVTLSLYLMTQCQLKLRHSAMSLSQTLDYIKVVQRRIPISGTLDQLTLKLTERKLMMYLTSITQFWDDVVMPMHEMNSCRRHMLRITPDDCVHCNMCDAVRLLSYIWYFCLSFRFVCCGRRQWRRQNVKTARSYPGQYGRKQVYMYIYLLRTLRRPEGENFSQPGRQPGQKLFSQGIWPATHAATGRQTLLVIRRMYVADSHCIVHSSLIVDCVLGDKRFVLTCFLLVSFVLAATERSLGHFDDQWPCDSFNNWPVTHVIHVMTHVIHLTRDSWPGALNFSWIYLSTIIVFVTNEISERITTTHAVTGKMLTVYSQKCINVACALCSVIKVIKIIEASWLYLYASNF